MGKSTRYFEIIQILRSAQRPVVAREIAETLEVSTRTVYRDIATLQSMRTPIEGEPGVGYQMRKGYDLPAVNFDRDEADAVALGLSLIARTGDVALWKAAQRAARKLEMASHDGVRLLASSWGVPSAHQYDCRSLRQAIHDECKVQLHYVDALERGTRRIIWPLALIYYPDTAIVVAWCELRQSLRHFRLDRIQVLLATEEPFDTQGKTLFAHWEQHHKQQLLTSAEVRLQTHHAT